MEPDLSNFFQAPPPGVFRLSKTESANVEHTLELTLPIGGTDVAPASWTIDASSIPSWLSLPLLQGSIGATQPMGNLSITANTARLSERSIPYTALLNLSVASQQRDRFFEVLVELYVSAPTLARTSIWGRPTNGSTCQGHALSDAAPIEVKLGGTVSTEFTACDFEGLAVDHVDKFEGLAVYYDKAGRFDAVLIDWSSGANHSLQIGYEISGTYLVLVQAPYLCEFRLRLNFIAVDGSTEQVGVERVVHAICPPGQTELSDGISCGCAAGQRLDENAQLCESCPVGEYCPEGATLGNRCPVGFTTEGAGAKSLDECGCPSGTYDSAAALPARTRGGAQGLPPTSAAAQPPGGHLHLLLRPALGHPLPLPRVQVRELWLR